MILNEQNYFSREAEEYYLSSSQYRDFVGTLGRKSCESRALAKLKGEWEEETTIPMLIGSYCDAHFAGKLNIYQAKHPEIFTKQGTLKSSFKKAEEVIKRIERDPFFMKYISGETQAIFTGEIGGAKWKCKIDSLHKGICIVDLKVVKSLRDSFWVKDYGHMSFVEYWGVDIQACLYVEIVRQNTGGTLPFFIAGASKEKAIDIEIIGIDDKTLNVALDEIEDNVDRILKLKSGEIEPDSCGVCEYCREVKVLDRPIHFSELLKKI